MKRTLAAICVIALLSTAATPALAEEYEKTDPGAIVMDVLLVRPLGIVSMTLGAGIFVLSLPFAIPSRSVMTVGRKLIVEPVRFTFTRRLGADLVD